MNHEPFLVQYCDQFGRFQVSKLKIHFKHILTVKTVQSWRSKLKQPDGQEDFAVLRGRRGRPKGSPDKAATKRWERCENFVDNQAEFVACCAWILKVRRFTF